MTSTIGVKKIQYPNGTNSITIDSSGSADITTANITTANVTNATATGTITTPSINGGQIGGRRNMIINGACQIAQRHTTTTNSNGFPVDRFKASVGNMLQLAQTLNQNTVSDLSGFTKSIKITTTTPENELTGGKLFRITYSAEGQDLQHLKKGTSDAEKLTLTFYVKSSITGTYAITFFDDSNSRIIGTTYTISSANTWEKKTILIAADTTGTITNDNTQGFKINWILGTGPSFTGTDNTSWGAYADGKLANGHTAAVTTTNGATWELTGVQLEVGEQATAFEHRSFGEELQLCKRYYYKSMDGSPAVKFEPCVIENVILFISTVGVLVAVATQDV